MDCLRQFRSIWSNGGDRSDLKYESRYGRIELEVTRSLFMRTLGNQTSEMQDPKELSSRPKSTRDHCLMTANSVQSQSCGNASAAKCSDHGI
jgi:hypothetical protein